MDAMRGGNPFAYGLNAPTRFMDPFGLDPIVIGSGASHGDTDTTIIPVGLQQPGPASFKNATIQPNMTYPQFQNALTHTTGLFWFTGHSGGVGVEVVPDSPLHNTFVIDNYKGSIGPNIFAVSGCNAYYYIKRFFREDRGREKSMWRPRELHRLHLPVAVVVRG